MTKPERTKPEVVRMRAPKRSAVNVVVTVDSEQLIQYGPDNRLALARAVKLLETAIATTDDAAEE